MGEPERERESSVTRLGDFSNFLVTNFLAKVVQIIGYDLGYFVNIPCQVKTFVVTFWAILGDV